MSKQILIGLFPMFCFGVFYMNIEARPYNKIGTKTEIVVEATYEDSTDVNHGFLKELAYHESKNKWKIVSRNGHIGKYQMSKVALKEIGLHSKVSVKKFKHNPHIFNEAMQDEAQLKLLQVNWSYLGKYKNKIGQYINGIKITKSGILAGCHLVGVGNMIKYLKSNGNIIPRDGNGISIEKYLKRFGVFPIVI